MPFWKEKTLEELTPEEWEALCDGCGKCCLAKYDSKDGKRIIFTNIACRLLDLETCFCKLYEHRQKVVKDCVKIGLETLKEEPRWVPKTCAYYLLLKGEPLPEWHPLLTGDANSVHQAKISIRGRAISETQAGGKLEAHRVEWEDL